MFRWCQCCSKSAAEISIFVSTVSGGRVCVCVSVCVWRGGERGRGGGMCVFKRERESVCVCARARACEHIHALVCVCVVCVCVFAPRYYFTLMCSFLITICIIVDHCHSMSAHE